MSDTVLEFTPSDGVLVQVTVPNGVRDPKVRVLPLDRGERAGTRLLSSLQEASEASKRELVGKFRLTYSGLEAGNQPVPLRITVGYDRGNRSAPDDPASGKIRMGLVHSVEQRTPRRGGQSGPVLQPLAGTSLQEAKAPAPLPGYPLVISGTFDIRSINAEELTEGPYIFWAE